MENAIINGVETPLTPDEVIEWDRKVAEDKIRAPSEALRRLRQRRNSLLADSDFSQLPDAPVNKDEWATYRQALRDLPETVDIDNPVYPDKP
jgi:gamma-glutamyltranspeptidase